MVFITVPTLKGCYENSLRCTCKALSSCMPLKDPHVVQKLRRKNENEGETLIYILLEPDILEREVKWALGSITTNKVSGGDGIPVELFQILKDDAVKVLHSICQQIWKIQQWPQDWKMFVFIPIPQKSNVKKMFKLPHNCAHFIC